MNRNPIKHFSPKLPKFVNNEFKFNCFSIVKIENIYVGLKPIYISKPIYTSIYKTPHYAFAKQIISGQKVDQQTGYSDYKHYSQINKTSCSEEKYCDLIDSFLKTGYDWQQNPILVFKNWRRPVPFNRWDVADGFHRLAILAALDFQIINVGLLKYKFNYTHRAKNFLKRFAKY